MMKLLFAIVFIPSIPFHFDYNLMSLADFKYGVNIDVNIAVSITRVGNTLLEVMCIC